MAQRRTIKEIDAQIKAAAEQLQKQLEKGAVLVI